MTVGLLEKRGNVIQGGCSFYVNDKLKSEIFKDKTNILCHNEEFKPENFNWEFSYL